MTTANYTYVDLREFNEKLSMSLTKVERMVEELEQGIERRKAKNQKGMYTPNVLHKEFADEDLQSEIKLKPSGLCYRVGQHNCRNYLVLSSAPTPFTQVCSDNPYALSRSLAMLSVLEGGQGRLKSGKCE